MHVEALAGAAAIEAAEDEGRLQERYNAGVEQGAEAQAEGSGGRGGRGGTVPAVDAVPPGGTAPLGRR